MSAVPARFATLRKLSRLALPALLTALALSLCLYAPSFADARSSQNMSLEQSTAD